MEGGAARKAYSLDGMYGKRDQPRRALFGVVSGACNRIEK